MKSPLIYILLLVSVFSYSEEKYDAIASLAVQSDSDVKIIQHGFFVKNKAFVTSSYDVRLIGFLSEAMQNDHLLKRTFVTVYEGEYLKKYAINAAHWNYNTGILVLYVPGYEGKETEIIQPISRVVNGSKDPKLYLMYSDIEYNTVEYIPLREDTHTNHQLSPNYKGFFTKHYPRKFAKKTSDEHFLKLSIGQPIINPETSKVHGVVTLSGPGNYIYTLNANALSRSLDMANKQIEINDLKVYAPPSSNKDPDTAFNMGFTRILNADIDTTAEDILESKEKISDAARKGHPIAQYFDITQTEKKLNSTISDDSMSELTHFLKENSFPNIYLDKKMDEEAIKLLQLIKENHFPPLYLMIAKNLAETRNSNNDKFINKVLEKSMHQGYLPARLAWAIFNRAKKSKQSRRALEKLIKMHNYKPARLYRGTNQCDEFFQSFAKNS